MAFSPENVHVFSIDSIPSSAVQISMENFDSNITSLYPLLHSLTTTILVTPSTNLLTISLLPSPPFHLANNSPTAWITSPAPSSTSLYIVKI